MAGNNTTAQLVGVYYLGGCRRPTFCFTGCSLFALTLGPHVVLRARVRKIFSVELTQISAGVRNAELQNLQFASNVIAMDDVEADGEHAHIQQLVSS